MNVDQDKLTDELLASYEAIGGINHLDGPNLPSRASIASITEDLLRLIFPGFFETKPIRKPELMWETSHLLGSVAVRLEAEIHKSLQGGDGPLTNLRTRARRLT